MGIHAARYAVLLVLLVSFVGVAHAESSEERPFARSGPYLGAGGLAQIYFGSRSRIESQGAGEVLVGYRLAPAFGVDLDLQVDGGPAMKVVGQGKLYPFSSWRVQPFLLAGIGLYTTFDFLTVGLLRPGVGADVYLTEHLVVAPVVFWDWYFDASSSSAPQVINVGATLQYRF